MLELRCIGNAPSVIPRNNPCFKGVPGELFGRVEECAILRRSDLSVCPVLWSASLTERKLVSIPRRVERSVQIFRPPARLAEGL